MTFQLCCYIPHLIKQDLMLPRKMTFKLPLMTVAMEAAHLCLTFSPPLSWMVPTQCKDSMVYTEALELTNKLCNKTSLSTHAVTP